MMKPSVIAPDVALRTYLQGKVHIGSGQNAPEVEIYSDWERPTNQLPEDFIVVYMNGDPMGVSMDTPFAKGYLMVSLYCKMNNDGSVKKNRIDKILAQIDELVEKRVAGDYFFEYDAMRFITPTSPNQTSGYSITTLNLRWSTTPSFNK